MFLVLILIVAGLTYEVTSDKEPVQLHQQERQYEADHSANKGK